MDDETCIERCRAGDAEAFRHIVERYQVEAMGHALAILGNRADAEDAVQEAFVRAFRALGRFEVGRRFYPWFYTILRNVCLKTVARARVAGAEPDREAAILAPVPGQDERRLQVMERALGRLSAEDRELITLKHLDGLTYEALAERLQVPPGTVMSRLYHARRRLRAEMDRPGENP